jgi:hypothetical protein
MSWFSMVGFSGGDSGVEIASIFDKIVSSLGANDPNTYAFAALCFSQASLVILWSLSWTLFKYLLYVILIFLSFIPAHLLLTLVILIDMCICIMLVPFSISSVSLQQQFNPVHAYQNYIIIPRDLLWDDFLLFILNFLGILWPSVAIKMVSALIFLVFYRSYAIVLEDIIVLRRLPVLRDFHETLRDFTLTCTILVVSCTMFVMDLFATY